MRNLAGRLSIGVSGQVALRAAYLFNTLGLVPVLIRGWGLDGYGQWLALTALASYLSYSNFGLVTTSANDMVIAAGAGDEVRAQRTFQMSINLTLYVILPLLLFIVFALSCAPVGRLLKLTKIGQSAALLVLAFSAAQLWLQTLRGLMVAGLYAIGSYGFAYTIAAAAKLTELIVIVIAVGFFHTDQPKAAAIMAIVAVGDLAVVTIYARRHVPWARFDLRVINWLWLKEQIRPAIGFAVSNLSTHGILIQGPRIVLSAILGGPAVATFAIYSTAMRLLDQLLLTLMLPMEIEIAHSVGSADIPRTTRLIAMSTQLCWLLFAGVAAFLMLFGPLIFRIWTSHQLTFSFAMMGLYLVMSAANQLGRVSAHTLNGTNRMFGTSFLMLIGAVASLIMGGALASAMGVTGMVVGCIIGELANSIVVIAALSRWFKKPIRDFLGELFDVRSSLATIRWRRQV